MIKILRISSLALLLTVPRLQAAHAFFGCDAVANKVALVETTGEVRWEYPAMHPQDCWILPDGNFLFCYRDGAIILNPKRENVWEYKAAAKSEVHSCQPLPNGGVMLVENGSSRILELDNAGKIIKEIKLTPAPRVSTHDQFRGARKTKEGHYVICFKGEHKVVELDENGSVLREIPVPGDVHAAISLPDGHLLVTCGDGHKVVELDKELKVVWEVNENDIPGNPLRLMDGAQRLPNGNTLFCNYLGHGHVKQQPQVFELTRDKKVVWEFADHEHFSSINKIQVLDVRGDVTKGEILR